VPLVGRDEKKKNTAKNGEVFGVFFGGLSSRRYEEGYGGEQCERKSHTKEDHGFLSKFKTTERQQNRSVQTLSR